MTVRATMESVSTGDQVLIPTTNGIREIWVSGVGPCGQTNAMFVWHIIDGNEFREIFLRGEHILIANRIDPNGDIPNVRMNGGE